MNTTYFGLLLSVLFCGGIVYANWVRARIRAGGEQSGNERLQWYERAVLLVVGVGLGSFVFYGNLGTHLSPTSRPLVPDVAHGFTHFFEGKYEGVYGTYFEYRCILWAMGWLGRAHRRRFADPRLENQSDISRLPASSLWRRRAVDRTELRTLADM